MTKYSLSHYLELALKSYGLPLWSIKGSTAAGCGVRLGVWSLQERHLYSRTNFKLNHAAALAEWRQLLRA